MQGNIFKKATQHFFDFHSGTVNIILHVVGFAGLFYSIYVLNWVLFAIFLVVVEIGHVYNHVVGIKPYDFRPRVLFWRVFIFILVILLFYFLTLVI